MSTPSSPPPRESSNILTYFRYTFLVFGARSLWSQNVLASYIYLLTDGSTVAVGNVTGLMGLCQVLFSVPSGALSDAFRRDSVLRLSLVLGLASVALVSCAVLGEDFKLLCVGAGAYGAFYGASYTAGEALLSDSIEEGERSKILTRKIQYMSAGTALGPTAAIAMFYYLGDDWNTRDCSVVILAGQAMCLPAFFMLCSLSDDKAVGGEEDRVEWEPDAEGDGLRDMARGSEMSEPSLTSKSDELNPYSRRVPVIIACSDLISGLASGMSIRFFPIFFLDNLSMSPITVQLQYLVSPLIIVWLSKRAQRLSKRLGRCQTTVFFKWLGIMSMGLMLASYHIGLPTWAVVFFYLVRTTTMNCCSALTKSQLYDYVKKEERGKFTVLESVNMFSWSGSAAVGGILIDKIGITNNFICTGTLQFVATIPLLFLFNLPSEEEQKERRTSVISRRSKSDIERPLLEDVGK